MAPGRGDHRAYPPDGFPTATRGRDDIVSGFHGLFANFETFDARSTGIYAVVVDALPTA